MKVYLVTESDDMTIGIFSTREKAIEAAVEYLAYEKSQRPSARGGELQAAVSVWTLGNGDERDDGTGFEVDLGGEIRSP